MSTSKSSRKSILASMGLGSSNSNTNKKDASGAAAATTAAPAGAAAAAPKLPLPDFADARDKAPSGTNGTGASSLATPVPNEAAKPTETASKGTAADTENSAKATEVASSKPPVDEELLTREDGKDVEIPDLELPKDDDGVDAAAAAVANDSARAAADALVAEEAKAEALAANGTASSAPRKAAKRPNKVRALTPVQRHYLLKALVSIQMQIEWGELEKLGALTQYGYPFLRERPKLGKRVKGADDDVNEYVKGEGFAAAADDPYADEVAAKRSENLQDPLILRHLFHTHLRIFPGLDAAPLKFWQKRIQPFFDEAAARNFSFAEERGQVTNRHFYTLALTRYLGGFFARGFGVRGEGETRGPGKGEPGSERWGVGKQWGKGTVKRGLDKPVRVDAETMDKIDSLFTGREGEVWRRARKETERIRRDWQGFKEQAIETETGVSEIMAFLDIGNIRNLPPQYRNAEEWARNHAAYIIHTLFVSSPSAEGAFSVLRGIHLLFPYWGAKQLLRVANAQTMIQGILNLLLARPGGAKSLVQRIFSYVIGKEAVAIQKDFVVPLRKEIDDEEVTRKIEEYVRRSNRPEGRAIRARSRRTGQDVLATMLLHAGGTQLSQGKRDEVVAMERAFAASPYRGDLDSAYPPTTPAGKRAKAPPSWGADAAEARRARRYAQMRLLLRECLRRRDREQAVQVASGTLVPNIVRDALATVFYPAIAQIARASDLASRLGDLQAFVDDLIRLKKCGDESMPAWIALAAKHENSLFFVFHECAHIPIMKEFQSWLQVGADYMAMSTTDPSHPANRKAKNLEVNLEELLQDDRLSDDDVEKLLAEVDKLACWVKWQKIAYELDMRKNFLLAKPEAAPASGLTEDDVPKGTMKQQMERRDELMRRLMEAEGVAVEDGVVRTRARGTEMADFGFAWFDALDPLHQHLGSATAASGPEASVLRFEPHGVSAPMPTSEHIRKAMPAFRELLSAKLPRWKEGDALGPPNDKAVAAVAAAETASAKKPTATAPAPSIAESQSTTTAKATAAATTGGGGGGAEGTPKKSSVFRLFGRK